jgi:hypothetical protein
MRTPTPKHPPAVRPGITFPRLAAAAGAILLFGAGVAAGIAYVTADRGPAARHEAIAVPAVEAAPPVAWQRIAPPPSTTSAPSASPAQAAPSAHDGRPAESPLVTRVTAEAKEQLEAQRPAIVSECWPSGGLPRGAKNAKVTLHVTFDAQGREIARGLVEDRRAPAGAFGQCLRKLPGTRLSLSPTGQRVAVAIPMTYP